LIFKPEDSRSNDWFSDEFDRFKLFCAFKEDTLLITVKAICKPLLRLG